MRDTPSISRRRAVRSPSAFRSPLIGPIRNESISMRSIESKKKACSDRR